MKRTMAPLLSNQNKENGFEEQSENEQISWKDIERETAVKVDGTSETFQHMTLHQHESSKQVEELSVEKYGLWRQEQNNIAARLEKQLQARWELEELIEEQLNRYHCHYYQATVPTLLKDVSNLLMPKWLSPHELAAVSWLGDWRPSAILDLLRVLSAQSSLSLSDSSEHLLSQVLREIRIDEAVIDEEFAEIQATCILHLPFSPLSNVRSHAAALSCVEEQFKKIERVITKAQHLRFKVLELVVKKVLNQNDAAEFLVAFTGVQDAIHQFAEQQKLRKLPPTVPLKGSGSI